MSPTARRIADACFIAILLLVGLALTEAAYRVYLRHRLYADVAAKVADDPAPTFHAWAYPPPWRFDRDLGFTYRDGRWLMARFNAGAFIGCDTSLAGNRYGNFAPIRGDYATADVKIAFFGSSYTLRDAPGNGDTATNLLQEALSRHLGKSVHILNYSRDSIGVLNMVDMARARLPIDRPDLIVFGFNTLSLIFQRNWRFVQESAPGTYRMYQTLQPSEEVASKSTILTTQVISTKITQDWCDRMQAIRQQGGDRAELRSDPTVVELVRIYNNVRRDQETPEIAVNFLTLRRSFILNFLLRRDPYYRVQIYAAKTIWGPIAIKSYREDPETVEAIGVLRNAGIPLRLLHVPSLADLEKPGTIVRGVSGVPAEQEAALIDSLEQLLGTKYEPLTNYYLPGELKTPLELVESKTDWHPNEAGTHALAEAMLRYFKVHPF